MSANFGSFHAIQPRPLNLHGSLRIIRQQLKFSQKLEIGEEDASHCMPPPIRIDRKRVQFGLESVNFFEIQISWLLIVR